MLRNYIFQVHASYEQSLHIAITIQYLKDNKPFEFFTPLFEQMSFEGKMRLTKPYFQAFPMRNTKSVNILRNEFAHKRGMDLRTKYDEQERLKVYRFLKRASRSLNEFWDNTPLT